MISKKLLTIALLLSMAVSFGNCLPATMVAVHKHNSILPCSTPFSCVQSFNTSVPTPNKGQVLVAVAASSINPCGVDYLEYDVGCSGAGGILGEDLSGTVAAVGAGVSRIKVGDKVWADLGGGKGDSGSMAEYALVSEAQTGLRPSTLNGTEAGTIPLVGLTAMELWQKALAALPNMTAPRKKNLTVVITSGSGGTGFMLVQLSKAHSASFSPGASRVVTSTSSANIPFVKSLGADDVIDYHKAGVFDALADDSVDIVIDNHGAKGTADTAMPKIKSGGVYVLLPGGGGGSLSKHPKAGVTQVNYGLTTSSDHTDLDILKELFESKQLRAHIYQQFPLTNAAAAFALNKAGHVVGKVAVVVNPAN